MKAELGDETLDKAKHLGLINQNSGSSSDQDDIQKYNAADLYEDFGSSGDEKDNQEEMMDNFDHKKGDTLGSQLLKDYQFDNLNLLKQHTGEEFDRDFDATYGTKFSADNCLKELHDEMNFDPSPYQGFHEQQEKE